MQGVFYAYSYDRKSINALSVRTGLHRICSYGVSVGRIACIIQKSSYIVTKRTANFYNPSITLV